MSSLPREILVDALQPLDRWTLDAVQITSRRFRHLIEEHLSRVCLREIKAAHFSAFAGHSWVEAVGRPDRQEQFLDAHANFAGFFSAFLDAVRSSWIAELCLKDLGLTPAIATLVLQTPIIAHELNVHAGTCAQLTQSQFHALVLHFLPTKLHLGSNSACPRLLRARQISDEFLKALSKNRVRHIALPISDPVDGDSFNVTDDAIINLCMQPDEPAEADDAEELCVRNGSFTKDLFRRLVEASAVSTRTRSLNVRVDSLRFEDEDLRDFAQRLSHRQRRGFVETRIYDFPGEQRGEAAAMDLKITLDSLYKNNWLTMVRARRPST